MQRRSPSPGEALRAWESPKAPGSPPGPGPGAGGGSERSGSPAGQHRPVGRSVRRWGSRRGGLFLV